MAKNTQPIAKRCKALGISPAVMGYAKKNTTRNSNGNMRKKQSEYASQLKEKQKVKFIYGVLEMQFHNAYLRAEARPGKTRSFAMAGQMPGLVRGNFERAHRLPQPLGLARQ